MYFFQSITFTLLGISFVLFASYMSQDLITVKTCKTMISKMTTPALKSIETLFAA
jgi:hypothetical protein